MGLEYSVFSYIGSIGEEKIVEKKEEDGNVTTTTTQRKNPWVVGVGTAGALLVLLAYIDGGKGMVTKVFEKGGKHV